MAYPAFVISQEKVGAGVAARVGGKALALAAMARAGIAVPQFVAVTTDAYEAYLEATGLSARIGFELERKELADMRWEELWDAALRIRNLFLTTPLPDEVRAALAEILPAISPMARPSVVCSSLSRGSGNIQRGRTVTSSGLVLTTSSILGSIHHPWLMRKDLYLPGKKGWFTGESMVPQSFPLSRKLRTRYMSSFPLTSPRQPPAQLTSLNALTSSLRVYLPRMVMGTVSPE